MVSKSFPEDFNADLNSHGYRDGIQSHDYTYDDPSPYFFNPGTPPGAVVDFHQLSDIDSSTSAQHHTLGPGRNQASPGNHQHDGGSSLLIPSLAAAGNWTTYITNANAASFWLGSGTNPVINNGTIVGKYTILNKLCWAKLWIQFGSTTTQGTGYWRWVLPFAAAGTVGGQLTGTVTSYAGTGLAGVVIQNATNEASWINHGNATFWGPGNPATWGTANNLVSHLFYETV